MSSGKSEKSPLEKAVVKNNLTDVTKLIESGSDVNEVLAHGWSVLHWSMRDRNIKVTEYLILKGAKVNAKTSGGNTPLHLAVFNAAPQSCQVLLKHGANVNAGDVDGDTPLHVAALKNCTEAGASLLAARPDLSLKNAAGDTALDVAAKKENRAIYGVLLGYKYASQPELAKDVDSTMQRNRAESMSRASAALEKHKLESIRAKKERDQLQRQLQEQEQQRLEAARKIEELERKAAEAAALVQKEAEERSRKEAKAKELECEMQKLAENLTEEAAKAQREAELRQQLEAQSAKEREELISDIDYQHRQYEEQIAAEKLKMNERLENEEVIASLMVDEATAKANATAEMLTTETQRYQAEKSLREAAETRAAQLQQIINSQQNQAEKEESVKEYERVKREKIRECGVQSALGATASSLEGIDIEGHLKAVFKARGVHLPPEILADTLTCKGWLIKQGEVRKTWKARWFVLDLLDRNLCYYVNSRDVSKPKGEIPLRDILGVIRPGREDIAKQHMFYVITPARMWTFRAADHVNAEIWAHLLSLFQSVDLNNF
eukprot:m.958008 g.958008  ORF g.958008 m.958008 type:complete len:551 (-) comp23877_c0_seq1:6562-8214(-)